MSRVSRCRDHVKAGAARRLPFTAAKAWRRRLTAPSRSRVRLSSRVANQPAVANGAISSGAIAVGALALGAVAIKRLAIKHAAIEKLAVGELRVGKLEVTELVVHREGRPAPDLAGKPDAGTSASS